MPRDYKLQNIDVITEGHGRVETGPLQINDDWPGVFIRGDNALRYGMALRALLDSIGDDADAHTVLNTSSLKGLVDLLASCNVNKSRTQT